MPQVPTIAGEQPTNKADALLIPSGDVYDRLLDQQAPAAMPTVATPPAQENDVYDKLLDDRQQRQKIQLDRALQFVPDRTAEAQSLAKSAGLSVDVVERNFNEVQRREKATRLQGLLATSPVLSRQIADPSFARIAHDDIENLTTLEREMRGIYDEFKVPTGPRASFGSVMSGLGQSFATGAESARQGMRMQFADLFGFQDMSQDAQRKFAGTQMQNRMATPDFEGSTAQGLYGGFSSVLQMAPAIGASVATGNPAIGLGIMGAQTQAQAYPKYRGRGASPAMAALGATGEGAVEVATEMLPMGFLVDRLGKVGAGEFLKGFLGRELLTEQVATITQDAIDTAVANPDKTWGQYLAERPDAAYQTALGTLVASGVFSGANTVMNRLATREQQAQQGQVGAQYLQTVAKVAQASTLRERAPDVFVRFVQDAAEGAPVQNVFIDVDALANVLAQSGIEPDAIAGQAPSIAAQFEEASLTGGTIRIPVGEFATYLADKPYAQSLIEQLRVHPDAMTAAEANGFFQSDQAQALAEEAGRVVQEQGPGLLVATQSQQVEADIVAQLDQAGRFTPDVNRAYAALPRAFFEVMAQRLDTTPTELYEAYRPHIVADGVPGANALNQNERGAFVPKQYAGPDGRPIIALFKGADLSSFLHESGHYFLDSYADMAANAPALHGDMQTLLDWFGVADLATWRAMDMEEQRGYHEKFARGFEAYLFEGRAPDLELQTLFARFRSWLVSVYRSISKLNVELTDDVRAVMGRMLASDEQIRLAEQGRSMLPLFESPDGAGMTSEEFAGYQALGHDATGDAVQELQARGLRDMQWLHNARGREIQRLQKESAARRKEARIEARREVMSQPVYRAWQFVTEKAQDGVPTGKLSRGTLADMYGGHTDGQSDRYALLDWKRLTDQRMTAEEGLHPDVVAEQFGFTSGDDLVRALLATDLPRDAIEALTDLRMLELYGDLSSSEAIERAADKAVHNDARARFVATELNALAKAMGKPRVLASAAKQFAEAMISRVKIRNLRPGQYAAAETRAGKGAEKAFKAGDVEQAAAEKRNQLVQHFAARAAHAAVDEVEATVRYLKKFDSEGTRKNLDTGYLEQIDALLERYDLRQQSNRAADRTASLRTWVQSRLNAGETPDIAETLLTPQERAAYLAQVQSRDADGELVYAEDEDQIKLLAEAIDRSAKRPYKDLTVEEFRGLLDTVKSIEHLARLKNTLLTARENQNYETVRDEIADGIAAHAKGSGKNTRTANDWLGQKLQAIKHFGASHIKAATWARIMDGGQDNGPVWSYIVRPANERASQETTMRGKTTEALDAIMRPILSKVPMGDKTGKGKSFPSIGDSLNWQERFAMALNTGNESNMQRLLDGKGWTVAQIKPVLDTLTAADWQAVQAVWDHFESYRPLIAEKEMRVSGKEPEWIAARPITVHTADDQHITLRGGYYPVVFDPRVNLKASQHSAAEEAKNLLKSAFSAATTRRSFVKSRVEEVKGRPLLLSLQSMYSGFNDVIHDLAWHEWVIDANKLLRSKSIDTAMREHYGPETKREFEKWRDDIVAGSRRLDHAIERGAGFLRQGVTASALTFNIVTAALQPLGLSNSIVRVGATWVGKGLARYVASPIEATREAQGKSQWMANRTRTRFRELNELRNQVQGQTTAKELMGRYGYWMMMQAQMIADVPTWWGAYEKGIAGGHDENTAVALADQAVKDSQGGGEEVDQSGVERGGPLIKLFTAFYGFMGTTLNMGYMDAKTESSKAQLAVNAVLLYTVPAVLGTLLKDALTPGGGDDDPDKLIKKLAAEQLSFLMGLVALGREFDQAGKALLGEHSFGYSGPAGLRMIPDIGRLGGQVAQGEFDRSFRSSFISVLGDLTGIPSVQINRSITGAQALAEGKTSNPAALMFGFKRY